MAMKPRVKTGMKPVAETEATPVIKELEKSSALTKMTTVSFRTRQVLKKKAEAVFEDMGISTSAAINMFLAQVVREKGMPFQPSAKKVDTGAAGAGKSIDDMDSAGYIALEELWNEM